jgi:integrase
MLANMRRPQQRYAITLYETGMRLNEPRRVTWVKVDFAKNLIRLDAEDVKENYPRRIPISYELRQVLLELKAEQQRVPNTGGFVFTRLNGRPIKTIGTAWKFALRRARLTNLVPHDLRRTAISRWTAMGIPRDFVMAASGHRPSNVHDNYLVFSDEQMVAPFRELMLPPAQRKGSEVAAA